MTPLFWISLTWVLAATAIGRLPLQQRFLPGAALAVASVPILLGIGIQISWLMALGALVAVISTFPAPRRLIMARYRGEKITMNPQTLRLLVVPGEL